MQFALPESMILLVGRSAQKLTWGRVPLLAKQELQSGPALPLPCCVTLEKSQSSEPQFPRLRNGDDSFYLGGFSRG